MLVANMHDTEGNACLSSHRAVAGDLPGAPNRTRDVSGEWAGEQRASGLCSGGSPVFVSRPGSQTVAVCPLRAAFTGARGTTHSKAARGAFPGARVSLRRLTAPPPRSPAESCRVVQRGRPSECGPPDLSAGVWLPWLDGASWDRDPRAGPGRQGRVGGSPRDGSPESRGHLQVVIILVNSWVWVRHRGGGAEPPEGERGVLAGSAPWHSDVTPRPRGTTGSALALFSVRKLLSVILKQLLLQWKFLL